MDMKERLEIMDKARDKELKEALRKEEKKKKLPVYAFDKNDYLVQVKDEVNK